ncbi:class E sortase [Actinomadura oligospora]|uniref:class E sortase n=1 Tax=Actinomadura oligospora TaxID=111804 RepID=UPI0004B7D98B|nr:class E sortase [Actinomadura oligospora]
MRFRQLLAGAVAGVLGWAGPVGPAHAEQVPVHAARHAGTTDHRAGKAGHRARKAARRNAAARRGRTSRAGRHGGEPHRRGVRKARAVRDRDLVEMIIPKLRFDDRVREGISESDLKLGVGHYPGTAFPGQVGNAVYLGHRTTGRAPFDDLEHLTYGDEVVLVSGHRRYVYQVVGSKIILPTDRQVLAPVPMQPGRRATDGWATLVTCYPRGLDSHRYVVFARLVH